MKQNKHFPKGLTLMELLVVVVIISLVMAIGGNTYRNQQKQVVYNDSVFKVLEMIKTARNYAVTSRSVFDPCEPLPEDQVYVPEEGYGVYFQRRDLPEQSRVVLFANIQAEDEGEANRYDETADCTTSDLIEEEFPIPFDAELTGLSVDGTPTHTPIGGGTNDEVAIVFRPPLAEASITVNDIAPPGALTFLTDLYIQFRRPESPPSTPSQYIYFNRIAGFPEIQKE